MQNSRLFSRLFPKTIIYFSTLKVIRKVITLKKAGTSSWRARLNKIWPNRKKKFTHIALTVALKKIFISFSRLFPGLETCAGQISRLFQEFLPTNPVPFNGYDRVRRQFTVSWILIFWYCIASLPNLRYAASLFWFAFLPSLFLI